MRENEGKMRTRITPNTDAFYPVWFSIFGSPIWEFSSDYQMLNYCCLLNLFSHLFNSMLVYVKFRSLLKLHLVIFYIVYFITFQICTYFTLGKRCWISEIDVIYLFTYLIIYLLAGVTRKYDSLELRLPSPNTPVN